jgi:hypothetical protein
MVFSNGLLGIAVVSGAWFWTLFEQLHDSACTVLSALLFTAISVADLRLLSWAGQQSGNADLFYLFVLVNVLLGFGDW